MNRITKASGLTLFTLLVLTAPVAAQVNVAGKWMLLLETPDQVAELTATLEQDGTTVTGVLELPDVEAIAMSNGMIEENKLTFILTMSFQGQEIAMEVTAEVDGEEMTGMIEIPDAGFSFPFTGKRVEG